MNKWIHSILSIVLFSALALAGNDAGNGGHGVVCRSLSGEVISIKILDFYEAEQLWGIHHQLGTSGTYMERVALALNRLKRVDPYRAERYQKHAEEFAAKAKFLPGVTLVNVPDTAHLAFPKGCLVEQIVNQRAPQFPEDSRYVVNLDLWNLLDDANKAGLVLHEVIYREAIEKKKTNSRGARYLNANITAVEFESITHPDYIKKLQAVGFVDYHFLEVTLNVDKEFKYFPNGKISSAYLISGIHPVHVGKSVVGVGEVNAHGMEVSFYENGGIKTSYLTVYGSEIIVPQGKVWVKGALAEFYADGTLKNILPESEQTWAKLNLAGYQVKTRERNTIFEFYESGNVKRARFHADGVNQVLTSNGPVTLENDQRVTIQFNEEGIATDIK